MREQKASGGLREQKASGGHGPFPFLEFYYALLVHSLSAPQRVHWPRHPPRFMRHRAQFKQNSDLSDSDRYGFCLNSGQVARVMLQPWPTATEKPFSFI